MRYCIAAMLFLVLTGCNQKNSMYYWQNPDKLKVALAKCPMKKPKGSTCDQLTMIASKFQYLGNELKKNPQLFGLHIIALQQKISHLEQSLQKKQDTDLAKKLKDEKSTLEQYLAVVSFYESPRGTKDEDISQ